ncbi:MAG: M42 family metallopeptidase [Candidatus Fermentibacteraceae bacterium]
MIDIPSFLMKLLSTRSVSGHTREALALVEAGFAGLSVPLTTRTTLKGSFIATIQGSTPEGIVLAAHLDTLGAMVSRISPDGTLRYKTVGGFTAGSIEGEYCLVETFQGEFIPGTILFDRASVHAYGQEKAAAKREHADMRIRLDMDVSGADNVRDLGVSVGNYVHFDPRPVLTGSGYIKGRHLDDKAGVAALAAAAVEIAQSGEIPRRTLHFMFTSHEEVGHGGAGWFPPGVSELIAVDMGVMGSEQTGSEKKVSICMADSNGPYNYELSRRLIDLAVENGIPHAVDTYPFYGSDTAASLRMGLDVRHALLGPGVDASHAVERTHLEGIAATARLVRLYSLS